MLKGCKRLSGRTEIHHWTLEAGQAFAGKKCLDRGDASGGIYYTAEVQHVTEMRQ